ncbi:flavin reductase family protein [Nocardioides rotundus]|uniref:flavin reductase family protein n=1 Tax=Nocardioides rotundus TaxID=1774216 RepID=UPI001CBB9FA7|nr:flavin reductase family protein [Nocardioides rotundus]UAL30970.1 flavin reductase family protein [Nocardioides rotundus]
MTIHSDHPFATPEDDRDLARRLRGRLGGAVTLWTTGEGRERAGLTVSSLLVALGEPAYLLGLVDPDSELADALDEGSRCVVQLLEWRHRGLAEQFAGMMPAPGGVFAAAAWEDIEAGPRLADSATWAACTVTGLRTIGWSLEVQARIDRIELGTDDEPLGHRRGRYVRLGSEP